MKVAEFDYELPPERIAQQPADLRDHSRLMVLRAARAAGAVSDASLGDAGPRNRELEHRRFYELPEILAPGDLLVVNNARVAPARLDATRATGGGVELLMLAPASLGSVRWRALARPARRVRVGSTLRLSDGTPLDVVAAGPAGERTIEAPAGTDLEVLMNRLGRMPLPPYIHADGSAARGQLDLERYQTVYAAVPGAVAAPTAGLHFTPGLMVALRERGIEVASVTLRVGAGTFRPITTDRIDDHVMSSEGYEIPAEAADAVNRARAERRRVVAVGTTSVRTLEHAADTDGIVVPGTGTADLYVRPGYRFRVVDAMITNFHLPRSTPLMMVAALVGRARLLDAYSAANEHGYRFYSYGDAMLLLP
ncbi:MAG TPA: tRNA preQ1(34) S-adenosylmethionine ribosyltransferase-isomerase QueA [Acidobacteriota bacterium]|nr:tRNA preQ1(34) S-adenosylmethionine ribosyltransferase-isomerase QueA [Acidobacteriota bacterium]